MSDTPRTDVEIIPVQPYGESTETVRADFARQLERELTAERIGHVTQTNMAQRLFDELSHLREGVEKLTEEVKHGTQPHGGVDDPDEIKLEDFAHKLRALLK